MIATPIEFSTESKDLIKLVTDRYSGKLTASVWSSVDLDPVKAEIKSYYKIKQGYRCSYCQQRILVSHSAAWDTEHIVARSSYPQFMFEPRNLCIACKDCNLAKSNTEVLVKKTRKTYPTSSAAFKIVHPHFDVYEEHIAIHIGHIYRPKSDKGKFTIITCDLLRFSYGHFGYDPNVASEPELVMAVTDYLSASDDQKGEILQRMMLITQIGVSRAVLD